MMQPGDSLLTLDEYDEAMRRFAHEVLWEIDYSPCPTCGWTVFSQTRWQHMRDDVTCQACGTDVPMSVLYAAEEDRVLGLLGRRSDG